jgi:type I restriction enzyme M protein
MAEPQWWFPIMFCLKAARLKRADLDEFVACYHPENRFERVESERFRCFPYDELLKRDKLSLDITWIRDESLEDTDNLPDPAILAAEIVEDLQPALDQFALIAADLARNGSGTADRTEDDAKGTG